MLRLINDGFLVLLVGIGHRTGLFDALDGMPPSSAAGIATAAGLNERYVREWLGAMACGGIVEHDPTTDTFVLPSAYADVLTTRAGPRNAAALAPIVAMLAAVDDRIVECFRHGGGTEYSDYPAFVRTMSEQSRMLFDLALIPAILPLVEGVVDRLERGIDVLDVGCGSGHAINVMAARFPRSAFVGYDLLDTAIDAARAESQALGLTNTTFEQRDTADLGHDSAFDFATTFSSIHDQAFPRRVLAGIARSLRPGGVYLCADAGYSCHLGDNIDLPYAPLAYTISTMHCMPVSLGLGGEGLGEAWAGPQALDLLAEAGFGDVIRHTPPWHEGFDYYVCRI
ncbi:MAG: class I SAM-dependent methyltransferase [Acidimicrobiia bacterium]|nr:class I SAM-dependent methyltransferase [Acidimicrobiia bacterium]